MRLLLPLLIALLGLAAGVGAGLALRPAPENEAAAAACEAGEACDAPEPAAGPAGPVDYVRLDKPFVVPVFEAERVVALVVVSLALEVGSGQQGAVAGLEPRLRDSFLAALFRHANSGGFEGSFTAGQKMDDLKAALLAAAREVLDGVPVGQVLVTDIVRQEV